MRRFRLGGSREPTREEIRVIPGQFAEAARRARDAGCDGIELHAAHAYMLVGWNTEVYPELLVLSGSKAAEGRGLAAAAPECPGANAPPAGDAPQTSVSSRESRFAWTRLLVKIYEGDALRCSRCGSPMKVLAVITDPSEVRRILLHLIKTGLAPPDLGTSAMN